MAKIEYALSFSILGQPMKREMQSKRRRPSQKRAVDLVAWIAWYMLLAFHTLPPKKK
jgi:hypothetical protein